MISDLVPALPGPDIAGNLTAGKLTIGIVGAGLIGASWAALFTFYGHDVRIWDPEPSARDRFLDRHAAAVGNLMSISGSSAGQTCRSGQVVIGALLEDAVAEVDFIQECGPEALPVKREILAAVLAASTSRGCLVVSSTSSHPYADLTEGLHDQDQRRVAIGHPFNPPHLVPLVEFFSPLETVAQFLGAFYASLGREAVRLQRSLPGHGANRLSSALWREAVHLVAEGVVDVEAADRLLVSGPGFRWSVMGPFLTYHLGGGDEGLRGYLNHLGDSQEARWKSLGAPRLDDETRRKLVDGMERAVGRRTIAELETERDDRFIDVLKRSFALSPGEKVRRPSADSGEDGVTIRPADRSDLSELAGLIAALAAHEGKTLRSPPSADTIAGWLFADDATVSILVACKDNDLGAEAPRTRSESLLGYLAWFRGFSPFLGGPTLMVENLYVTPESRGRGLGRRLMRAAAQVAMDHGIERMELTVSAGNQKARQAYLKMGYRETAEEILRLQDGDLVHLSGGAGRAGAT